MIYLASPYTDNKVSVRRARYNAALDCTAELMKRNIPIFSPIVHCHEIARRHVLPKDHAFWWKYNQHFLRQSDQLLLLIIDGWQESKGVRQEIEFANNCGIGMAFVSENGRIVREINPEELAPNANS